MKGSKESHGEKSQVCMQMPAVALCAPGIAVQFIQFFSHLAEEAVPCRDNRRGKR